MISFKGMHNTVTVWTDDGKQKLRKHYLVMHLREVHQLFCQLCPTEDVNIISFSKFCSLCPKNVLLTGDTPQYQCKCMVHENLFSKPEALGHSYDRYESHILFGKYHATYLLGAYLPHSVWCIYLQPALRINWSVKFTLLLKAIGVAGMHLTLLSTTLSSWSKPEYIKC